MNPFLTPLIIAAALVATFLLVVWLLHTFTVRAGRKELQAYKEQVMLLSDKLDALKERHKLLPQMVRDFAGPMSGETLACYNTVAERLQFHRQTWLKLMDAWEQAQALLEAEHLFGSGRARSARRDLRAANAPAELAAMLRECEEPLGRIEQAHAQAAADLKSYQQEDQKLGSQLESITAAALSTKPYELDRLAAASLVEQAQGLLPANPLGTLRCLSEARGKIAETRRLASKILEYSAAAGALVKKLDDVERASMQRRSQGFLLQEEGANPDPLLAEVRQQHSAAQEAINQADETAAGTLLSQASALIEQARQGMEQHVAAKTRCESEFPARQAEARRLADVLALTRAQQAELTRDFAAETWLPVAENVQRAQATLTAADQNTAEAARIAAAGVQHFLHASKLLDQAAENHKHAQTELTAVGTRLHELVELRAACQAQIGRVCDQSDRLSQLLLSSNADRMLVNERFRAARLTLNRVVDDLRQPRPDWIRLTARVREIDTDLDGIEQLAKQDILLAQQAAAEIAETERVIREARGFHDQGFTPDVSVAESQLAQAQGCLAAQGYEEAIRLANTAKQMARIAQQGALSQAQRRQQEMESQLRPEQDAANPSPLMQAEADPR